MPCDPFFCLLPHVVWVYVSHFVTAKLWKQTLDCFFTYTRCNLLRDQRNIAYRSSRCKRVLFKPTHHHSHHRSMRQEHWRQSQLRLIMIFQSSAMPFTEKLSVWTVHNTGGSWGGSKHNKQYTQQQVRKHNSIEEMAYNAAPCVGIY